MQNIQAQKEAEMKGKFLREVKNYLVFENNEAPEVAKIIIEFDDTKPLSLKDLNMAVKKEFGKSTSHNSLHLQMRSGQLCVVPLKTK